ncbi:MAG: serine hydrolase domain-containing protein [Bacteroidia bacterium]|nr:serine hydrolase domain-containing protein [Bacteroidia bacterium]
MIKQQKTATFLLVFLLFMGQVYSQKNHQLAKEHAQALFKAFIQSEDSPPGISVAVRKGDQTIYAAGFGIAKSEDQAAVTPNTRFRAASVSKMMTTTAMAKLYQEGKLDFDKAVSSYVPQFPKKAHSFSVAQLSGHIAGFPHYSFSDKIQKRFYPSVSESLGTFSHQKLLFEPGTKYKYSTHGYTLLSAVIEGASQMEFLDYLDQEIFEPLGMQSSGPDLRHAIHKDMSELFYINKSGKVSQVKKPQDPSYKWGGGGMTSTPSDLVKLGSAYYSGFFSSQTVDRMFQTQALNDGKETWVGIGWRTNVDPFGRKVHEHAGSMEGTRSVICIFPEEKMSVSIMGNASRPHMIEESAHVLASLFLSEEEADLSLKGKGEVDFVRRGSKKQVKGKGQIQLEGAKGILSIKNGDEEEVNYQLIKLRDKDLYGLITEYGILFCQIKVENGILEGGAILYGSMRPTKVGFDEAFISFSGDFTQE